MTLRELTTRALERLGQTPEFIAQVIREMEEENPAFVDVDVRPFPGQSEEELIEEAVRVQRYAFEKMTPAEFHAIKASNRRAFETLSRLN